MNLVSNTFHTKLFIHVLIGIDHGSYGTNICYSTRERPDSAARGQSLRRIKKLLEC